MGQLDGKVALITGAGSGIGQGIAAAYAAEGATLVIAGRRRERLAKAAEPWGLDDDRLLIVEADVTAEDDVVRLFGEAEATFGRVDVLVNNAGAADHTPIDELSLEKWRAVVDVNLNGAFLCTREALKLMKRQRAGRIINIGSLCAQVPRPNTAAYTATKHALVGLTKSTALEGRGHGVNACCLHPGNTRSELEMSAGTQATGDVPIMNIDEWVPLAVLIAALPNHVNLLESIVLPTAQPYGGRG